MNTNPQEINLFPEHRKRIAQLADSTGLYWTEALQAVLNFGWLAEAITQKTKLEAETDWNPEVDHP